jgi:fructose-specific component phosphotransferase system IIB-like protein
VAQSAELPDRGEIRWALVPHAAQAPFSIDGAATGLDFETASALIRSHGPRAAVRLILPAVVRPVLLLHGWESAHHGAYAVLRTRRVSALSPAVREALRAGTADDLVLLQGASAGHQRVAMLAGLTRAALAQVETDRARAIALALSQAQAADVVLVAGKGHEAHQEVQGQRLPFSDREQALRALQARRQGVVA